MAYYIGIDCGSAACKGVLISEDTILSKAVKPTGWNPKETATQILDELLSINKCLRSDVKIGATGYGRVSIDFAERCITEITCHGLGADFLLPGVRTVIDIGGQDSKAIELNKGKVVSFQMNDKCAAGTGRFLEMTAMRLGVSTSEFELLLNTGASCQINSMCAVFADSEIVSLLAAGKTREEIAGGIIKSIASRASALAARISVSEPIMLTGGLSYLKKLQIVLGEQLAKSVEVSEYSRYAGAIGAAIAVKKV